MGGYITVSKKWYECRKCVKKCKKVCKKGVIILYTLLSTINNPKVNPTPKSLRPQTNKPQSQMHAPKIKPNNGHEHAKNIIIDPTYANDEEKEKKIE